MVIKIFQAELDLSMAQLIFKTKHNPLKAVCFQIMKDLKQQYKDESNLQKRIQIHKYGVAEESWQEFLKQNINLGEDCKILEIGCGTGMLWKSLLENHPPIKQIVLSDFSDGMLENSKENLKEKSNEYDIQYKKIDATSIPFENNTFDIVIANHVLYHVTDVERSLSEISRVLKAEGQFFATTIGKNNMLELKDIVHTYFPSIENDIFFNQFLENFSLENALQKTNPFFKKCERTDYEDYLLIPHPEPLIEYIESFNLPDILDSDTKRTNFKNRLLHDLNFKNGLRINKEIGLITCQK